MSKKMKISILIVVLVVAGLAATVVAKRRAKEGIEVTVAKLEREDLTSRVSSNGNIEAKRKVDMSANIMGQITNLAVREGDVVKKGDFLLQIDRAQHAASAASASASLQSLFSDREAARATAQEASLTYARAQKSYNEKLIPGSDLERARAQLDSTRANLSAMEGRIASARANVSGAQNTLSKTTLRAPMDGIITRLPVEEGEVAVIGTMNNPGTVLLTISDMSVVEATMEVDETDIPSVKLGQQAEVTIDAYPNQKFKAVVTEVGSSPRNATAGSTDAVDFEVKLQLQNPPGGVRPGFSASAEIITSTRAGVVSLPLQALVVREKKDAKGVKTRTAGSEADKEEEGVYVFDRAANTVKFILVTTGVSGEASIEILNGVKEGTEIVTGPFKALRELEDGKKVRLAKEPKKKKDGAGDDEDKS